MALLSGASPDETQMFVGQTLNVWEPLTSGDRASKETLPLPFFWQTILRCVPHDSSRGLPEWGQTPPCRQLEHSLWFAFPLSCHTPCFSRLFPRTTLHNKSPSSDTALCGGRWRGVGVTSWYRKWSRVGLDMGGARPASPQHWLCDRNQMSLILCLPLVKWSYGQA